MEQILIAMCAAGNSSRMGETDKLLVELDGEPMLRRQVLRACEVEADVLVAHNPNMLDRVFKVSDLPVENATFGGSSEGLSGTLRGVAHRAKDYDFLMVVLADMPLLTSVQMARMAKAPRDFPDAKIWRATGRDGQPGHPIVFAKEVLKDFADLSGDDGAKSILEKHRDAVQMVPLYDDGPIFDVDTKSDLAQFEKLN